MSLWSGHPSQRADRWKHVISNVGTAQLKDGTIIIKLGAVKSGEKLVLFVMKQISSAEIYSGEAQHPECLTGYERSSTVMVGFSLKHPSEVILLMLHLTCVDTGVL